jgi:DNA-binding NarL/FixJ family response regulator
MKPIRVLLVDDHPLFLDGIAALLSVHHEFRILGRARDGCEAVEKARALRPDLILMDIRMPRCSGLEATRQIKQENPETRIVMLTVSEEDEDLFEAIKSGAQGYLLKSLEGADFFGLLRGIASGEVAFSPGLAMKVLQGLSSSGRGAGAETDDELSSREREVLELLSSGATNREIATGLSISEHTVRFHLRNILNKLHLRNRTAAATYALRRGIVPEPPSRPT